MDNKQREQARLRKQRQRDKEKDKSVTLGGVTSGSVTTELFEGKPRYIALSDNQVLDRTYRPKPNKFIPEMIACNRANEADLSRGMSKARRVAMVMMALDRDMRGLDGKKATLGSMVRYGVSGLTFDVIGDLLEATR